MSQLAETHSRTALTGLHTRDRGQAGITRPLPHDAVIVHNPMSAGATAKLRAGMVPASAVSKFIVVCATHVNEQALHLVARFHDLALAVSIHTSVNGSSLPVN